MVKEIIIVRHGETALNVERRFQGWVDGESPLTVKGHLQAEALGKRLSKMGMIFDKVYSSSLRRARETTEDVIKIVGQVPVEYIDVLRERGYGRAEKKHWSDFGITTFGVQVLYSFDIEDTPGLLVDAEPLETVLERARRFAEIIRMSPHSMILVIGHEAMNSYLVNVLLKENPIPHPQSNADYHYLKLDSNGLVQEYRLSQRRKNILIASSGFKDVFDPIETAGMLKRVVQQAFPDAMVTAVPMADGGEWSTEVLSGHLGLPRVAVPGVIDPRGVLRTAEYVLLDPQTAFIAASAIVRLPPELSAHKNPMHLTSYGYGQLIRHAIAHGCTKIFLGMGGTSTVDGGIGMAQALGMPFIYDDPAIAAKQYLTGGDLPHIRGIAQHPLLAERFKDISVEVLCDSGVNLHQLYVVTKLKVSDAFAAEREQIVALLNTGLLRYSRVVSDHLAAAGTVRNVDVSALDQQPSIGNSGGIILSLLPLFDVRLSKGVEFFYERLGVQQLIQDADLVITGEGRLEESSLLQKTPTGIGRLAKRFGKPVVYLVGDIDEAYRKQLESPIARRMPPTFAENGISAVLSCHPLYSNIPDDYQQRMAHYREQTPRILLQLLSEWGRVKSP